MICWPSSVSFSPLSFIWYSILFTSLSAQHQYRKMIELKPVEGQDTEISVEKFFKTPFLTMHGWYTVIKVSPLGSMEAIVQPRLVKRFPKGSTNCGLLNAMDLKKKKCRFNRKILQNYSNNTNSIYSRLLGSELQCNHSYFIPIVFTSMSVCFLKA